MVFKRLASTGNAAGPAKRPRAVAAIEAARSTDGGPSVERGRVWAYEHLGFSRATSQIRLLELQAGPEDSAIHCGLAIHEIDSAPAYHAISYTWGPVFPQREILVNGLTMTVREACYYALRQARLHSDKSLLVWVDSICINQSDAEEKALQVGMIADIFSRATEVFACIGRHANNSQLVFQHAAGLCSDLPATTGPSFYAECESCVQLLDEEGEYVTLDEEDDPIHGLHLWASQIPAADLRRLDEAVHHLSERSYWERMWIYPEVAMAQTISVMCGDSVLPMDKIRWLIAVFHWMTQNVLANSTNPVLKALAAQTHRYQPNGPIWLVMATYFEKNLGRLGMWLSYLNNGLQCSLAFDKIYASRSLLDWDPHFALPRVDYDKSAIELLEEILPHNGNAGLGFPSNVRALLETISCDVVREGVDLRKIWQRRNGPIGLRDHVTADQDHGPGSCTAQIKNETAIWRCALWHDEAAECQVLLECSNGNLAVFVEPKWPASKRPSQATSSISDRPKGCLAIFGLRNDMRSTELAGFACSSARPGDYLVCGPGGFGRRYLVVRHARDDIFEIIGFASVFSNLRVAYGTAQDQETHSVCEVRLDSPTATPVEFLDFWLDAEDVLAYAFPFGSRSDESSAEEQLHLLSHRFTRSRFSSFATRCLGREHRSIDTSCPHCAFGSSRQLCIECGASLEVVQRTVSTSKEK